MSERTALKHQCVKKRRWLDKDITYIRLAHRVFQMFYEMTTTSTKQKTMEEFIQSRYYTDFVKFGRACVMNEYINAEKFAEWLIKNSIDIMKWPKSQTYSVYLLNFVKHEPGIRALERTIVYLADWAIENDAEWQDYFSIVSPSRAVHDIKSGKVSPWTVYLASTGDKLLSRFSTEQAKMVNEIIDADFWIAVFKQNPEAVKEVQEICKAANF